MVYIAFLRGINIGKAKQVKMALLKEMLEEMGLTQVKTLLNSGNVIFDAPNSKSETIKDTIEQSLSKTFGFDIPTIIRTTEEIQALVVSNPFKDISVTSNTRQYVTFLSEPTQSSLSLPYIDNNLTILSATNSEVSSVIEITPNKNTTDLMGIIEKAWGKNVTTRNWNTVQKIAALL